MMTKFHLINFALFLSLSHLGLGQVNNVRIDHIPIAVKELAVAEMNFENLGFTIKKGRMHQNGLLNFFIKFQDGSYIELISPTNGITDSTTEFYSNFLDQQEGGAAISLSYDSLASKTNINQSILIHEKYGPFTISTLEDPDYSWLFFIEYHPIIMDKAEILTHENQVTGIKKIHLKNEKHDLLTKLINDSGLFIPDPHGKTTVSGITLIVKDIYQGKKVIENNLNTDIQIKSRDGKLYFILPAEYAHGVWLEFEEM